MRIMKLNPLAVFQEEFDHSAVLFRPDTGESFMLNPTAAFLWQRFAEGYDVDQAFAALKEACVGELPENARGEVSDFIAELKERGYLAD